MYYVYVLFSKKDRCLYTGSTPNLKTRIIKHKKGFVKATKNRLPIELVYYESYALSSDAKSREIFLKGGKGKAELKVQLKGILIKLGYRYLDAAV